MTILKYGQGEQMEEERRQADRCPLCQGPAKTDKTGQIKCRRSTCKQNHAHVSCPRCGGSEMDSISYEKEAFVYTCTECTKTFKIGS